MYIKAVVVLLSLVFVEEFLCFCEESYVVICDDLWDFKFNDTSRWKYVLIGSSEYIREPPDQILDSNFLFNFNHVKSLTIINQVNSVRTPLAYSFTKSNLEYFNLYENEIKEIEDETFKNLKNLKELYLKKNRIEFLGRAVFKNLTLDVVDLSRNGIRRITTGFYQSHIKWIKINQNKLNSIKNRAFPQNLEQLELDHNELSTLDKGVFENLSNLKELSVKHNQLTTFPDIASLKMVQYLHFSFNKIHIVNYRFEQNPDIEYIDLSYNKLKRISLGIFSYKGTIPPVVKLSFNRLTNIIFDNPGNKTDLSIYGNPLKCDCLSKIENILSEYKHSRTCEVKGFLHGQLPVCVVDGPCDDNNNVDDYYIDKFLRSFNNIEDPCEFHI